MLWFAPMSRNASHSLGKPAQRARAAVAALTLAVVASVCAAQSQPPSAAPPYAAEVERLERLERVERAERPERTEGFFGQQLFNQVRDQVRDRSTELVTNAMNFLGVPYKRGGTDEATGLDCSAFVRKVFDQTIGLVLPRRSADQSKVGTPVDKTELKPGDLVFFNTLRRSFSHVGIYIGDGKFVHSPRAGGVVRVEDMRVAYWQKRYNGARRVAADEAGSR